MGQDPLYNQQVNPSNPLQSGPQGQPQGEDNLSGQPSVPFNLQGGASAGGQNQQVSPMDLSGGPGSPTSTDLLQQGQQIDAQMDAARQQLQNPGVQFRPTTSDILSQHLNRINDNLSNIGSKLNLPPGTSPPQSGGAAYFLNYLTGSQKQLRDIMETLATTPTNELTAGKMLGIQVKMTGVQQQMEFFTVLLGKAMDDIKTMMNIQS